jgi:DNA-binding CsgD family transcriptional regulator
MGAKDRKPASLAEIFAAYMPAEVATAYQKLVEAGSVPDSQAEETLGGAEVIRQLTDRGLAVWLPDTLGGPACLQPVPPELALAGQLAALGSRLQGEHKALHDGLYHLADLQGRGSTASAPGAVVEVITDRQEVANLTKSLIHGVHKDWMMMDAWRSDTPYTESNAPRRVVDIPDKRRDQVRRRCIYDRAFAEDPIGMKIIKDCVAKGEEAAILPEVAMKLMIADTSEALIAITSTGAGAAARFRGGPPVIAFREYFEMKWTTARLFGRVRASAPAAEIPLNTVQREILDLLDEGLTDDQIARHVGLVTGSVRRHIIEIRGKLGVQTRWAACVEAHRRGWVGTELTPQAEP